MNSEEPIEFDEIALNGTMAGADILGNVLAEGARLISAGKISQDVIAETKGAFAVCLVDGEADCVRELRSGESVTIGRAEPQDAADWQIDDKWLSKRHFTIAVDANGVPYIEDLASLNGTFVNDSVISAPCQLARGNCIRAGHSLFLFL